MKGYYYSAYGLTILSEIPIRELQPSSDNRKPQVTIKWQQKNHFTVFEEEKPWVFNVEGNRASLYFKDVGLFLVTLPGAIEIQPALGVSLRMIERYLSNLVLAVLLYLRGCLVFHASACKVPNFGAILIVGDTGAGKSTLALGAHCKGLSFMTDDVAALSFTGSKINVLPSYPRLKTTPKVAEILQLPKKLLEPVDVKSEELYLKNTDSSALTPAPLRALFFLRTGAERSLTRVVKKELMLECIRNTIPTRLLQQPGNIDHFNQCSTLAVKIPAYSLVRTSDLYSLDSLVSLVLKKCCR